MNEDDVIKQQQELLRHLPSIGEKIESDIEGAEVYIDRETSKNPTKPFIYFIVGVTSNNTPKRILKRDRNGLRAILNFKDHEIIKNNFPKQYESGGSICVNFPVVVTGHINERSIVVRICDVIKSTHEYVKS